MLLLPEITVIMYVLIEVLALQYCLLFGHENAHKRCIAAWRLTNDVTKRRAFQRPVR